MLELLVIVSGFVAGIVSWFPFMIGLASHRYKLGGAQIRSSNRWVLLITRAPGSFSVFGRILFVIVMITWTAIFFGAMVVPMILAKALGIPDSSPSIGYAIYANMLVAAIAFFAGPAIWRRVAL